MTLLQTIRALFTTGRGVVQGLPTPAADADPIALFQQWFAQARDTGLYLPEAIALATSTPDGRPSVRMMLLKGVDSRGFTFFTNYESRKGEELAANPRAAFVMHWSVLQRQIRVEGSVERLSERESADYFRSRPRGSRIGAWASKQSHPVADRAELERRYRESDERYRDDDVPLPPYWGGFRLRPERIEFWQCRVNRLHDRLLFTRQEHGWTTIRLQP